MVQSFRADFKAVSAPVTVDNARTQMVYAFGGDECTDNIDARPVINTDSPLSFIDDGCS